MRGTWDQIVHLLLLTPSYQVSGSARYQREGQTSQASGLSWHTCPCNANTSSLLRWVLRTQCPLWMIPKNATSCNSRVRITWLKRELSSIRFSWPQLIHQFFKWWSINLYVSLPPIFLPCHVLPRHVLPQTRLHILQSRTQAPAVSEVLGIARAWLITV